MSVKDEDYTELRNEIRNMKPSDKLYKLLKEELTRLGYWWPNYQQLKDAIRTMKRWHPLYKLLKEELTRLNYWQLKPRGNPKAGFKKGLGKQRGEK